MVGWLHLQFTDDAPGFSSVSSTKKNYSKVTKFTRNVHIVLKDFLVHDFFFWETFSFWDMVVFCTEKSEKKWCWITIHKIDHIWKTKSEKSEIWFKIIFGAMRDFPESLAAFEQINIIEFTRIYFFTKAWSFILFCTWFCEIV